MAAHRTDNDTANNLRNYTTPRDSYGVLPPRATTITADSKRDARAANERRSLGSRAAVRRRSERGRSSSAGADDDGGLHARSAPERSGGNQNCRDMTIRRPKIYAVPIQPFF